MKNKVLGLFKINPSSLLGILAALLIGILLLINPSGIIDTVFLIIAWALIIIGGWRVASSLLGKGQRNNSELGMSALLLVVGIALLIFKGAILGVANLAIALLLIVNGVMKAQTALDMRRVSHSQWLITFAIAAAMIVFGLILIIGKISITDVLSRIVGVIFIIEAAQDLFAYIRAK